MSLSNSLRSTGSQPVTLMALSSIPTTEDLRYLMATAKKSMKPVSLPFKKDAEGPTFVINFAPPNRWTFTRMDQGGLTQVWVKESIDVLMIQNKVKIDSATIQNYSEQAHYQQVPEPDQAPDFALEQQDQQAAAPRNIQSFASIPNVSFPGFLPNGKPTVDAAQSPVDLSNRIPEQSFLQASLPTPAISDPVQPRGEYISGEEPVVSEQAVTPAANEAPPPSVFGYWAQGFNFPGPAAPQEMSPSKEAEDASTSLQTKSDPIAATAPKTEPVPGAAGAHQGDSGTRRPLKELTPFELDQDACDDIKEQLCDPNTGLISIHAFTFFLVRESIRSAVAGTNLSVVVFDFCNNETGEVLILSPEVLALIAYHLDRLCSVLHISTRMDSGEFAVLLSDSNAQSAVAFVEAFCAGIGSEENLSALYEGAGSFSIGIAAVSEVLIDPAMLIAAAIEAKNSAREQSLIYQVYGS